MNNCVIVRQWENFRTYADINHTASMAYDRIEREQRSGLERNIYADLEEYLNKNMWFVSPIRCALHSPPSSTAAGTSISYLS